MIASRTRNEAFGKVVGLKVNLVENASNISLELPVFKSVLVAFALHVQTAAPATTVSWAPVGALATIVPRTASGLAISAKTAPHSTTAQSARRHASVVTTETALVGPQATVLAVVT